MKKATLLSSRTRGMRHSRHVAFAALFFGTFALTQQVGNADPLQNPVNGGTTDPNSVYTVDGNAVTGTHLDSNSIDGLDFLDGSSLYIYNTLNLGESGLTVETGAASLSGGLLATGDTSKWGNGVLILNSGLTVGVYGDFSNLAGATHLHGEMYVNGSLYNIGANFNNNGDLYANDIVIRDGSFFNAEYLEADDIRVGRDGEFATGSFSETHVDDISINRGSASTGFRSLLTADDIEISRGSFTTGTRSRTSVDDIDVSRGSSFTTGRSSSLRADDIDVNRGSSFTTGRSSSLRADDIDVSRGSSFTTGRSSSLRADDIDVNRGSSFTTGRSSSLRADDIDVSRGSSFTTGRSSNLRADDIDVNRGSTFTTGSSSNLRADEINVSRGSSFTTGRSSNLRADYIDVSRGSSFTTGRSSDLRADYIDVSSGSSFTTGSFSETIVDYIDIDRGSFITGFRSTLRAEDIDITRGSFTTGVSSRTYVDDIDINRGSFTNNGRLSADDIDVSRGVFVNDGRLRADDIDIYRGSFENNGSARVDDIDISRGSFNNNGYLRADDIDVSRGTFVNDGRLRADDIDLRRGSTFVNGASAVAYVDDISIGRRSTLVNNGELHADDITISRSASLINTNLITADEVTNRGTLVNNGVIDAAEFYNTASSLLKGTGTITGDFYNAGVLNPGNSPGTTYVSGNYIQLPTGTLIVEIGSTSNHDRLIVGGSATLNGTLQFTGNIVYGGKYRFLKAGSIVGQFANVLMPNHLRLRLLEKSTSLTALFAPATYSQLATNPNHRSVAKALDRFINAKSGDKATVSLALDHLSQNEYYNAFQQISPALHETVGTQAVNLAQQQGRLLQQRVGTTRYGLRGSYQSTTAAPALQTDRDGKSVYQSKAVKEVVTTTEEPNRWSAWIEGNGVFSRVTQAYQVPNGRTRAGGFLVGTDYAWNPNFITGLFAGYEGLETKYTDDSRVTMNGGRFGGYGTYNLDNGLYFDGIVWGGAGEYEMHRRIKFGSIDRTARSTQKSGELSAIFGTGYDWKPGNFIVGPTAALQYTYLGIDGFEETGAKSLNLDIDRQQIHSLRSNLGARIAYRIVASESVVIVPELRASWEYEFLNDGRNINGQLGGKNITYRTQAGERSSLFAGAGINALFNNRVNTSVNYNVDLGRSNDTAHIISASFGVTW